MGLPTMLERPHHHDVLPPRGPTPLLSSISMTPRGVQGARTSGSPVARRPTFTGWKPSTSLSGSMASRTFDSSICRGNGQLDQDAVNGRVRVQFRDQIEQFALAGRSGQGDLPRVDTRLGGRPGSSCPRTAGSPDRHRRVPWRGPGTSPASASTATRSLSSLRMVRAISLPEMIPGGHETPCRGGIEGGRDEEPPARRGLRIPPREWHPSQDKPVGLPGQVRIGAPKTGFRGPADSTCR